MNTTYNVQSDRLTIPRGVVYRYHTAPNNGKAEAFIEPVCVSCQQPDIMAVSIALEILLLALRHKDRCSGKRLTCLSTYSTSADAYPRPCASGSVQRAWISYMSCTLSPNASTTSVWAFTPNSFHRFSDTMSTIRELNISVSDEP